MCNQKQPKELQDEKGRDRGKGCLEGPPRKVRISLSKSGVSQEMQIRQICTENLGAPLLGIKSSSFELVFSSAARGCRGTIGNYFPLPRRRATGAQSHFSQIQQIAVLVAREYNFKVHHPAPPQNSAQNARSHIGGRHGGGKNPKNLISVS